ncbi:MAG: acyl-CoA dehydrogenase family protein [Spirochaetes bacterium]|nr:acyl-CoA dehydrogenase family protein [Spirochaetota bacterium]
MPLFLTDEQKALKETVRKFTEEEIIPVRQELDEKEEYPAEIINKLVKDLLLACPFIPEEYDGAGLGVFESALIVEELARGCLGVCTAYAVSGLGLYPILIAGTNEQKLKYASAVARGEKIAAFGLTESSAGSDIGNLKTTAVKKSDIYVLNGVKQWITSASKADIYSVFAVTDRERGPRGISCFIVEKDTPGFTFGAKEKKLGIRCSETRELIFEDCEIPAENLLGREGHGFRYALETLNHSRAAVAASAVGVAQAALEIAVNYASERIQYDNPISSLQVIQHKLADMSILVESGRHLAYTAARMIDMKHPSHSRYSTMAKAYCGENAFTVANTALQIMGGYGYMRDFPIEKILRDAKILSIYEGTTEVQKNAVFKDLMKEMKNRKKLKKC